MSIVLSAHINLTSIFRFGMKGETCQICHSQLFDEPRNNKIQFALEQDLRSVNCALNCSRICLPRENTAFDNWNRKNI
uniref:Uncharacterized protein n=1 Tax=Pristionchus pacificus TaxID=54126 RepID=A0A2A6BG51_PRIPA|eukprot:PDM64862.1 hypothetical protein PRIPAC_53118 [Pristionchus pacificus]